MRKTDHQILIYFYNEKTETFKKTKSRKVLLKDMGTQG